MENQKAFLIITTNGKEYKIDDKAYLSEDEAYAQAHDTWQDTGDEWDISVISIQEALLAREFLIALEATLNAVQGADDLLERKLKDLIARARN